MPNHSIFLLLLIVMIGTAITPTPLLSATETAPVVVVEKATPIELADEITYPARVVSKVNAAVNADVDGIITKVTTSIGQKVRAKTPLFRIKNTDPVYEYVPVTIVSPLGGVVSSVDVAEGTMVKRGQQLATITDPTQIRVVVEIAASDLGSVSAGLTGQLALGSNKPIGVKVVGVSPMVDPATGTAQSELMVTEPTTSLPVGLIGRVSFKVNRRKGLQVPEQALVFRGQDTFLRIADRAKAKMIPVVVAATHRGMSEIATGLKTGDLVIVRSSGFVADGQEITVQEGDVAKK